MTKSKPELDMVKLKDTKVDAIHGGQKGADGDIQRTRRPKR